MHRRDPGSFERLERALEKQGAGPLFNGEEYSLVDAAYAPFLQRNSCSIASGQSADRNPRLKAWADTLIKRPSTHSFPEAEFERRTGRTSSAGRSGCRSSSLTWRSRRSSAALGVRCEHGAHRCDLAREVRPTLLFIDMRPGRPAS